MPNFDYLKPIAAHAPKILHKVGQIIDAHGDGDGSVEISDVIEGVKEAASHVVDAISDVLD